MARIAGAAANARGESTRFLKEVFIESEDSHRGRAPVRSSVIMNTSQRKPDRQPEDGLPSEIYISLVASLYADAPSLFIGSMSVTAATLLTAWKADSWMLYACAAALALIAVVRANDMLKFARKRSSIHTPAQARVWEIRYIVGSALFFFVLGMWCFITFVTTQDEFVRLMSISATLAYIIGISGRNFGSSKLVVIQSIAVGIPMVLAQFLQLDVYYAIYGLFLIPFLTSLGFISARLRRTLLDAIVAAYENRLLARRFDTALNNMSHGLSMFNRDQRMVVSNRRLTELLGAQPDADAKGLTPRELLLDGVASGSVFRSEFETLATEFESRLAAPDRSKLLIESPDGKTLDLTFQPMEGGGSVVLVEDITERRNAEAKIRHLARYDALTGLPNRTYFHDQMDEALASTVVYGESCAVLFVDLDQFKQVNDTLGHPAGDALLCEVADRLRRISSDNDVLARFGGDEFVILCSTAITDDEAAALADRIVEELEEPYEIDGHEVIIGASVGIAVSPRDGVDTDLLLKNADMALYRAKADGRGAWRFFKPEMDIQAQARRGLELDLRNALANNAFRLFYQPLINLKTKRISTCEALLRWPHPERGMVSPADFIPIAEEMGLIVDIGRWVLREACAECRNWPQDVHVAVNFSPIQFRRGNVPEMIRQVLAETGLEPSRLDVEITESVLLQDTQATHAALRQICDLGVQISLDDFGTGYSSLSYLHSFPLHKVKIDRSFLEGLESGGRSEILFRGIARLSAELGMVVAVEGIETQEQLALVASEPSIEEVQGWLFSAAIPGSQIRQLLVSSTPSPALEKRAVRDPKIRLAPSVGR
jgi:diguanylate cyclase (GGDEF)-like protein